MTSGMAEDEEQEQELPLLLRQQQQEVQQLKDKLKHHKKMLKLRVVGVPGCDTPIGTPIGDTSIAPPDCMAVRTSCIVPVPTSAMGCVCVCVNACCSVCYALYHTFL